MTCLNCSADIPSTRADGLYGDGEEIPCPTCAAVNVVEVDVDEGCAEFVTWRCVHGVDGAEDCDACEAAEAADARCRCDCQSGCTSCAGGYCMSCERRTL